MIISITEFRMNENAGLKQTRYPGIVITDKPHGPEIEFDAYIDNDFNRHIGTAAVMVWSKENTEIPLKLEILVIDPNPAFRSKDVQDTFVEHIIKTAKNMSVKYITAEVWNMSIDQTTAMLVEDALKRNGFKKKYPIDMYVWVDPDQPVTEIGHPNDHRLQTGRITRYNVDKDTDRLARKFEQGDIDTMGEMENGDEVLFHDKAGNKRYIVTMKDRVLSIGEYYD